MALAAEWLGGGEGKGGMGGGRIRDQLGGYCSSPGRDGKAVGETWDSFWRRIGTCFFVLFLFVVVVFIFGHTARECRILVPGPGMEPPPPLPATCSGSTES